MLESMYFLRLAKYVMLKTPSEEITFKGQTNDFVA